MVSFPDLDWFRQRYAWLTSTLVAFVICFYRMGAPPLGNDEACSWWTTQLSLPDLFRLLGRVDAVLAPYYFLLRGWTYLFGDSELSLRMPSTIAISIAAGLIARIGERLGDANTGLFAGLYFAVLPSASRYAQETRPYALAVLAATAAFLFLLRTIDDPNRRANWFAYAASIAFIGVAHLVSLACLCGHAVALLVAQRKPPWVAFRSRFFWRWTTAVAVGLLPVLPIVWLGQQQSGQLRLVDDVTTMLLALPRTLPMSKPIGWLLIGLAAIALLRRRTHAAALLTWAVLPPVLLWLTYDWVHLFRARYLVFTLPAWTLLAALATTQLPLAKVLRRTIPLVGLAAIAVFGWQSHRDMRRAGPQRTPYRIAAEVLSARAQSGDAIAFGGTSGGQYHLRLELGYAMRHEQPLRDVFVRRTAAENGGFKATECNGAQECSLRDVNRLWLLTVGKKNAHYGQLPAMKAQLLRAQFVTRQKWPLGRFVLSLHERPDSNEPTALPPESKPDEHLADEPETDDSQS